MSEQGENESEIDGLIPLAPLSPLSFSTHPLGDMITFLVLLFFLLSVTHRIKNPALTHSDNSQAECSSDSYIPVIV